MAHIYLLFDFAHDEEKAQQARQKLERWKQAFRLDKKLLYKIERTPSEAQGEGAATAKAETPQKTEKVEKAKGKGHTKGKGGHKADPESQPATSGDEIKLLVRLGFSGHEKLTEERWVQRIPTEEPFQDATPKVVKSGDAAFEETEKQFEELS
jgi:hypothetical protein